MRSGLRLALLKPAALPVTSLPDPQLSLLLLFKCNLCLVFVILFKLFNAAEGISLRAGSFDGGTSNIRVGCE